MSPAFRPGLFPTLLTLTGLTVLVSLGVWQVQRLAWKEALLAEIADRRTADPTPLPPQINHPEDWRYRPVTVTGRFDHVREMTVFAGRQRTGGWYVVTPLMRPLGPPVLINRGWVPDDKRLAQDRPGSQPLAEVTIRGLARLSRPGNRFTPVPDPATGRFFAMDLERLAAAMELDNIAPILIDAEDSGTSLPQGGQTRIDIPNRHLEYAATWFALAAVLTGVYLVFGIKRARETGQTG